jgi:5-formyltetrahydrofolate cyclo-ligase
MATQQSADELSWMKASQRSAANRVRAREHEISGKTAGGQLAARGLDFLELAPGTIISGYHPYRSEIDIIPLLERLAGQGFKLALPVVVESEKPLAFRAWAPGDATQTGELNIEVPLDSAPEVEPDVLLVPLLAFDDRGYRLGYGGGYYDRTLEELRARKQVIAVGVAYSGQEVGAVVRGVEDQQVDWILTEKGPMRPESS